MHFNFGLILLEIIDNEKRRFRVRLWHRLPCKPAVFTQFQGFWTTSFPLKTSAVSIDFFSTLQTIPPILSNNYLLESTVDKLRRHRIETKVINKPVPPTPYLMHLNVLSRTQYITEYLQSSNKKESANKYIDGLLGSIGEMTSNETSLLTMDDDKVFCTDDEREAVVFVLSDVLRYLATLV